MITRIRYIVQKRLLLHAVGVLLLGNTCLLAGGEDWVVVAGRKDFPAIPTETLFETGYLGPLLGFRHQLESGWLMGVNYQIIKLRIVDEDRTIWLQTLGHEANYQFRLDHPWYLGVGSTLRYFVSSRKQILPIQRDSRFGVEIGVGATGSITYFADSGGALSFSIERWRGVMSDRFHLWSVVVGTMIPVGTN